MTSKISTMTNLTKSQKRNRNRRKNGKTPNIGRDVGLYGRNALAPVSVRSLKSIGFPATTTTKHRYIGAGILNAAVGALGIYQFRTNSLFDPDLTGTGHQPYGFDQWKTYYGTYMVTRSQIAVECFCGAAPTLAGVYTSTESSTGFTDAIFYGEPGRGQSGVLNTVFGGPRIFEARWDLRDIPNHDPADYSALVSTNPANSDFYTVFSQDSFGLAASPVLYWAVCIEFEAVWKDPLSFAPS